jgi:hypothetical protein
MVKIVLSCAWIHLILRLSFGKAFDRSPVFIRAIIITLVMIYACLSIES